MSKLNKLLRNRLESMTDIANDNHMVSESHLVIVMSNRLASLALETDITPEDCYKTLIEQAEYADESVKTLLNSTSCASAIIAVAWLTLQASDDMELEILRNYRRMNHEWRGIKPPVKLVVD